MTENLKSREEISLLSREIRESGRKVVFTNGCFDIIHKGHVLYLNEAKRLGDILVVGLNSDASVKRLKGETRPVNNEKDRAIVLLGLSSVDYVCIFNEDTSYNLIKAVQPNVLVKGGDWGVHEIVGSDIVIESGGEVYSLNFYEGYSSTKVISKLAKE